MDYTHMNHYEKQLYTVFKTFDVNNEEALDRTAVLELCDALQLEDRGAVLADTLFDRRSDRVTFTQFRNGLLTVLGGGEPAPLPAPPPAAVSSHSDDESSGREVAPKFVFGSKKYGRRSRPQHISEETPRARVASASRLEGERTRQRIRCKRSASAMETRNTPPPFTNDDDDIAVGSLDHDRRVDRERALALCQSLRMTGIDGRLVDRIFENLPDNEITVGDFFDRLNTSLTSSIAATLDESTTSAPVVQDVGGSSDHASDDAVNCETVVEAWERAGVQRPRRLLLELGFTGGTLRPAKLEGVLDEELRALSAVQDGREAARDLLLMASLALGRLRLERAQGRVAATVAERDKLRADLAEANRRARLLAQDVDENHARIETELKASLRQVEVRHAEAARAAASELAAERERAAASRAKSDQELLRRSEIEARLRTEASALRDRVVELEARVSMAEERATAAERERTRLRLESEAAERSGAGAVEESRLAASRLEARVEELRLENQSLRDRNDELCTELEALTRSADCVGSAAAGGATWQDEAEAVGGGLASLPQDEFSEEFDLSSQSLDQNVVHNDEVLKKLRSVFEKLKELPSPRSGICDSCDTAAGVITAIRVQMQELTDISDGEALTTCAVPSSVEVHVQTEPCCCDELRKSFASIKQSHEVEKAQLMTVIGDLESNCEQLKVDYDKCEEYWSAKLEEERDMFNEEQRAGDERLAELVAKIAEYERQFAPTLPTIEEKYSLELQFTELEEEFAKYRKEKESELAERMEELTRAKQRLEELERRVVERRSREHHVPPVSSTAATHGPAHAHAQPDTHSRRPLHDTARACAACASCAACAACVGALRARASRAERAAQRLAARLTAADLLVKDLYIENCRLAHRPRPL